MEPKNVTVSNRGYILLPLSLRKELEIKPGTRMLIKKENDKIILQTVSSFTRKLTGLTRQSIGKSPKDVDHFIDRERRERKP